MNSRRQITIGAIVAVILTILFFFALLKPTLSDISKTQDDVTQAKGQQETLQLQVQHLQDVRKNAPVTIAKLAALSQFLPSTPDLPGFIRLVQDAATLSGVDLQSIAPSPPATLDSATGVSTITVALTCQGGFFRIEDFLARLENLQRTVLVRSLNLAPTTTALSNSLVLNSTISLTMFVASDTARAGGSTTPAATPTPSATATP
jgi:Tfp pilus assembly protein PilO